LYLNHLPFVLLRRRPPRSIRLPYTTLFRSDIGAGPARMQADKAASGIDNVFPGALAAREGAREVRFHWPSQPWVRGSYACYAPSDRKSTRLNSSHVKISYAVFRLKKKNI